MIQTGLFFGSFNPIHNGHIALAKYLLQSGLDEIWFVVSPHNPLKNTADLWDDAFRLQLVRIALNDEPQLQVSDIEFTLPKPNYTIDTLRTLKRLYPDRVFVLLIGADNAAIFDRWKNYDEILNSFAVWAYPRVGYPNANLHLPQIRFVDAPLYIVSSTEIRQRLTAGQSIRGWVPDCVADVIECRSQHANM
ncbi:MAG: nicotinate (nicotinamide) nucleotide adenylyltransferase [Paludibacteraceae bacterium]